MLLRDKLGGKKVILASDSPRRKELLAGCGVEFVMGKMIDIDESYPENMRAEEIPKYIAKIKSKGYPVALEEDDILITADTLVIIEGEILGKPKSRDEAVAMIQKLSGERHSVVTGVAIRSGELMDLFSVSTDVWFRELRTEEIEYYVDNFEPYDKAGGYGIQEWIGYIGIGRIEGSFYNVMGMPVQSLCQNLEAFLDRR